MLMLSERAEFSLRADRPYPQELGWGCGTDEVLSYLTFHAVNAVW